MSMISEQIRYLREFDCFGTVKQAMNEAADTIEALSAKISAENMERSTAYYNIVRVIRELNKILSGNKEGEICVAGSFLDDIVEYFENQGKNSEWISCSKRFPVEAEYIDIDQAPYLKRLEVAYMTDTVEYLIGFYDGCKWMDKHHNIIKNVIAWKPFMGLGKYQ